MRIKREIDIVVLLYQVLGINNLLLFIQHITLPYLPGLHGQSILVTAEKYRGLETRRGLVVVTAILAPTKGLYSLS